MGAYLSVWRVINTRKIDFRSPRVMTGSPKLAGAAAAAATASVGRSVSADSSGVDAASIAGRTALSPSRSSQLHEQFMTADGVIRSSTGWGGEVRCVVAAL